MKTIRPSGRPISPLACVVYVCFFLNFANPTFSQDWPQINGPDRNGIADSEAELYASWPKDGPKVVWDRPVGQGFAGPAIKDNKVVIFHRPKKDYLVEVLDARRGDLIWKKELPSNYGDTGMEGDAGPKAVPLIHKDKVILLGTGGNLTCLDFENGNKVWDKNVLEIYKSPRGFFGAGASPIAYENLVILMVGGDQSAFVALDLDTGEEVWKSFDDRATYSSPIIAEIDGQKLCVFVSRLYVVGVEPESGKVVFKTEFGKRGTNAIGAMPVAIGDSIFVNAAYRMGAKLVSLKNGQANTVWENGDSFASHYSTPIYLNGYLYGTTGRIDYNSGSYRCIEAATGKVQWVKDKFPVGHTLLIDNRLVVMDSDGSLSVLMPALSEFRKIASAKIFDGPTFAMPAYSNGRLYARCNARGGAGKLACLQIGVSTD